MATKAISTKDILLKLGKDAWHIPQSAPNTNATLKNMVSVDAKAARLRHLVEQPFTVTENVDKIEKNLGYLEQNRATQSIHQTLNSKFTPLRAEAIERETQRAQLLKDIMNTIHKELSTFRKLAEEIGNQPEKKPTSASASQIAAIDTIKKDVADLSVRNEQFVRNATALNTKLEILYHKEVRPTAASVAPPQETTSINRKAPE